MWVVNASVVTLLPSNGVLMGPNGLPVWLCNRLECLLVLNDPVSSSGMIDLFIRQCNFVMVASSKICVCPSVVLVTIISFLNMKGKKNLILEILFLNSK